MTLLLWAATAAAQAPCPLPGEKIHWIADYCMAELETDDEIAVGDCIAEQLRIRFSDECLAKRYFKRQLCQLAVKRGVQPTVQRCMQDPAFVGSTVRNGGVGR